MSPFGVKFWDMRKTVKLFKSIKFLSTKALNPYLIRGSIRLYFRVRV
jgi:hypothetical protein